MNFATEYSISFLHTTTYALEFKFKMLLTITAYLHVKSLISFTLCVAVQNYLHVNLASVHLAHGTRKCSLILVPEGQIRLHFFCYDTIILTCILYRYLNVGTVSLSRCSSVTCGYGRPCHSPTNMSCESRIVVNFRLLGTIIRRHVAHAHVCEVYNAILWIFYNACLAPIYYVTISLRTFVLLYNGQAYQLAKPQLVYNCVYIMSPICYVATHNNFICFVFVYGVIFVF